MRSELSHDALGKQNMSFILIDGSYSIPPVPCLCLHGQGLTLNTHVGSSLHLSSIPSPPPSPPPVYIVARALTILSVEPVSPFPLS